MILYQCTPVLEYFRVTALGVVSEATIDLVICADPAQSALAPPARTAQPANPTMMAPVYRVHVSRSMPLSSLRAHHMMLTIAIGLATKAII